MFNHLFKNLALPAVLALGGFSAVSNAELKFRTGTMVELHAYDDASDTYVVVDTEYRSWGPYYVKTSDLIQAVPGVNANRVRRDPTSVLSEQYVLDTELKAMVESQVEQIRKKRALKLAHD